ncbi:flagellar brake protein [Aestuariibacter sp. AA17]|uniref:Flagellar brake protein n=1 Tax=Fluctibacter corallii TaxID=2984329 RepID=A0ABT3A995_9ALTE|nr:flagellar brake protein [Aestuariibacter sp. AA17]MCV2885248.1 flagellar brake protein [Aestuariibacter sp. AA17]
MAILREKVGLSNKDLKKLRSMRPGMPLDLQVKSPTGIKRVKTEFIGMDGTRCLIIKFPDEGKWGSLRDAIYTDNSMVVRYILEDETGEIVAFKVKVTLVLSKPGNYIFTTFPLSLQSHGLRAEERSQTQVPAALYGAESEAKLCEGVIHDLSNSGCRIGVSRGTQKNRMAPKTHVKIHVTNFEGETEAFSGTIMNAKSDELSHYYGIKFAESEAAVEALRKRLLLV